MASNKFVKLTVKLSSGNPATLYLGAGNFVVSESDKVVCIDDGAHNNGGWKLHVTETYDSVIGRIDQAMQDHEMLPRPPYRGIKD
jgi:hypothetical protein